MSSRAPFFKGYREEPWLATGASVLIPRRELQRNGPSAGAFAGAVSDRYAAPATGHPTISKVPIGQRFQADCPNSPPRVSKKPPRECSQVNRRPRWPLAKWWHFSLMDTRDQPGPTAGLFVS